MGTIDTLRQLYEQRRLEEAWEEYQRLRTAGPVEAEGHLLGALTARLRCDLVAAKTALMRAEESSPVGAVLGRVLMTHGVVLREAGDIVAAIEKLEAFLAGFDRYPDLRPVAAGAGHYNVALAYRYARRYDEARTAYQVAITEFRQEGMSSYLGQSLRNLAWLCCLSGDYPQARVALEEAAPLANTSYERWDTEVGWACFESVTGLGDAALSRCQRIIESAGGTDPASEEIISQACGVAGRIALSRDDLTYARALADSAVDWAIRAKWDTRSLHDASELRREIHERVIHKRAEGA